MDYYNVSDLSAFRGSTVEYLAFYGCNSLESVVIGDHVKKIGVFAFYSCNNLKTVSFGEKITCINESAFQSCTSLQTVVFSDQLTAIGKKAFSYCSSLQELVIPKKLGSVSQEAFLSCKALRRVFFKGTAEEWNIWISSEEYIYNSGGNSAFTNATRYYFSADIPFEAGNYWYYDQNGNVCIWGE